MPEDTAARAGTILGWIGLALCALGCCLGVVFGLPGLAGIMEEQGEIPVSVTPPVSPQQAQRGYLGVRCEDVEDGAKVIDIITNSPAEKSGLYPGDVITRVGTSEVRSCYDLAKAVWKYPGEIVEITVHRGDETINLNVALEAR